MAATDAQRCSSKMQVAVFMTHCCTCFSVLSFLPTSYNMHLLPDFPTDRMSTSSVARSVRTTKRQLRVILRDSISHEHNSTDVFRHLPKSPNIPLTLLFQRADLMLRSSLDSRVAALTSHAYGVSSATLPISVEFASACISMCEYLSPHVYCSSFLG